MSRAPNHARKLGTMLKITVQRDETKSTLLLEGKLAGAWVAEVENSWRDDVRVPWLEAGFFIEQAR